MTALPPRPVLPVAVKVTAALFVIYGIAAVVNAIETRTDAGWIGSSSFPRALLRLVGTGIIAWGLVRGARWAWWVGLVASLIWLGMGSVTVLVMHRGDVHWLQPSRDQLFLAVSLVSVGLALGLLVSSTVREAFRAGRAGGGGGGSRR